MKAQLRKAKASHCTPKTPNTTSTDEVGSQGVRKGRMEKTNRTGKPVGLSLWGVFPSIVCFRVCKTMGQFWTERLWEGMRSVGSSCIMMWSDEPVKPLRGSPLGVHTILCLGHRSSFDTPYRALRTALCLGRVANSACAHPVQYNVFQFLSWGYTPAITGGPRQKRSGTLHF